MQGPPPFAAGLALGALGGASAALAAVSLVWAWRAALTRRVLGFSLHALDHALARLGAMLPPGGAVAEELGRCRELCAAMGRLVQ